MTLPFTQKSAWFFGPIVLLAGMPWSPLALWTLSRSYRGSSTDAGKERGFGWLKISLALLITGTIVPGLSSASGAPAFAGIVVAAASALEFAWKRSSSLSKGTKRGLFALASLSFLIGLLLIVPGSVHMALTAGYYRQVAILLSIGCGASLLVLFDTICEGLVKPPIVCLLVLACLLKLGHWGIYVPEHNYRMGQGPWGRAIGQWVPPGWKIFTLHSWPADLMLQARHPVQQIPHPFVMEYLPDQDVPKFLLLHKAEFDHWPKRRCWAREGVRVPRRMGRGRLARLGAN